MKKPSPFKFFLGFLLTVPLIHVIFIFFVFLPLFDSYLGDKHRIINIRKFDNLQSVEKVEIHLGIIKRYFKERTTGNEKPLIVVLGSSFSYGYCFHEDVIFSSHLQATFPDHLVINAAVIGINLDGTLGTLKVIKELDLDVHLLIFDTNMASYNTGIPISGGYADQRPSSVIKFFLKHPPLWDLANLFLNDCSDKSPQGFVNKNLFSTSYEFTQKLAYEDLFRSTFELATNLAENVIFFINPQVESEFVRSGINTKNLVRASSGYIEICKDYVQLICLNPMFAFDIDNFMDISHLSLKGHKSFHDYLLNYIPANHAQNQ